MKSYHSNPARPVLALLLLLLLLAFFPRMTQAAPRLSQKKAVLTVGESVKLKVDKANMHKLYSIAWTSNKPKTAKVSQKGKVTALKTGKAVITARVKAKKTKASRKKTYTLTCTVKVKTSPVTPSPTPLPTATPTVTPRPTVTPSPAATPTPTAAPTEAPQVPASQNFNFTTRTVKLNNGVDMPILGIGTYLLSNDQAEQSVYWALKDGYRLIDTARIYGNETGVGRGIQRAIQEGICRREDIFVTTKMWTSDFDRPDEAIEASLSRLGLTYIDLMILHHSQPWNDVSAYQGMERAAAKGKLRCIGLSNYYTPEDFDRLVKQTSIVPALLQNETHPYHQSTEMKAHLAAYGTVLESWFPLGGRGNTQTLFSDPTIKEIAAAHQKTSAQVIFRWHLQAGNIAIPGSSNEAHILENSQIFDFTLSPEEMKRLTDLDRKERFASY